MESPSSFLQINVKKIKGEIFSSIKVDPYSFVCPSAYDTAWLAMIPDHSQKPSQPMFKSCLHWLLNNQNQEGFWGECDGFGKPTLESLPATLASIVALKKWNTGAFMIDRGLSFIEANTEKLLKDIDNYCPRWFTIVFPAMVELSENVGLETVVFQEAVTGTVSSIFRDRQNLLEKEELVGKHCFPPLLSYLEAFPPSYTLSKEDIYSNLSGDGSLFQSPSATAKAFMVTGETECLDYLQSLIQRCPNGVPQAYPMDEDLIKLCVVDQLQKLGLGEHFVEEIEEILTKVYRNYVEQQAWVKPTNTVAAQLQKDSLAFQLLRMHGYRVSPSLSFRWFLDNEENRTRVEKEAEFFSTTMLCMYRASSLMFCGEYELEEANSFSRDILKRSLTAKKREPHVKLPQFHKMVERELNTPWLARPDHLDHRMWIEENEANFLWEGKTSHIRISHFHNADLLELAMQNYEFKQSIYRNELEELKRWSQNCGLTDMGFGREKTTYCYYAIAAATTHPHHSYVRKFVAKSAIIITVADDFFDVEGSLSDLEDLTNALRRWDSRGLSTHSKVIFDALDNLVSEAAEKYLEQQGGIQDIKNSLRDLWYETLVSWLVEAKWKENGQAPSIDDYLKIGMISIATHTMVLPASCFLKPGLPYEKLRPDQYETITKLLMVICRLLNDIQSHEKEIEEGKLNFLMLNLMRNPNDAMEDSVAFVTEIIDKKKKEFLQHVLVDGQSDLPKPTKLLHLTCFKVFQMFYSSCNGFDCDTELLDDINKAIYLPLSRNKKQYPKILSLHSTRPEMKYTRMQKPQFSCSFKHKSCISFSERRVSPLILRNGYGITPVNAKALLGFI